MTEQYSHCRIQSSGDDSSDRDGFRQIECDLLLFVPAFARLKIEMSEVQPCKWEVHFDVLDTVKKRIIRHQRSGNLLR